MALINCPECGNEVSTKAESCPKCGFVLESNKKKDKGGCAEAILFFIGAFAILFVFMFFLNDCSTDNGSYSTESTYQEDYSSYATVTINTIVDGVDVQKVNLWQNMSDRDKLIDYCINGEEVKLLRTSGEFVKLRKSNGSIGWCMKGFIRF